MFTWAFVIIEALSAVGLIFLVLLHSGRGGGISDLLGGSMGAPQFFLGPMAKQHRMAALNLGLVGTTIEVIYRGRFGDSLWVVLIVVAVGSLITCGRRALAVIRHFSTP